MDAPFLSIGTVNQGKLYKLLTIIRETITKSWSSIRCSEWTIGSRSTDNQTKHK